MSQTLRDIPGLLKMRPKGVFVVTTFDGKPAIVIHRRKQPPETIICLNMADVNRRRMELSRMGMFGMVEDAI